MAKLQGKFEWTKPRAALATLLADGYDIKEAAEKAGVAERTAYRWRNTEDFAIEVDRLSCMIGIASRAERLRIAKRVARQKIKAEGLVDTKKDLLEWLLFAAKETDEVKLGLAELIESFVATERKNDSPVPEEGSGGNNQPDPDNRE